MPPSNASSRLSQSSCRTTRRRLAPSAVRIAISRLRDSSAGEKKVGHVSAGDQQNERDRAQHDQQRRTDVADDVVVQSHDSYAGKIKVRVGILFRKPAGDGGQFRFRLLHLHARFQPADHA